MQRCTLHCSNVAGMSFLQGCENDLQSTLYNVVFTLCVCGVYVTPSGLGGPRGTKGRT